MSITRHHNDWLLLVPNSGPFLSLPVLAQAFPQGLDAHDADHARRLRMAFEEWDEDQSKQRPDPTLHRQWTKFVLSETLGYKKYLAEGQAIPQSLQTDIAECGETLKPDWIVNDPATNKARLLVQVYSRSQSLTKPVHSSRWNASPDTRMMQLLHDTGIRLGIITNGDHWMLVNAPKNETTGYASWYANLWLEEKDTLRAFRTLLCGDRFFGVTEKETIEALLDRSAADQQEVTDQLGYQVRKAVEVLIQAIDKADQDNGRKLLAGVEEKVLYESALTVMMRLVFLFCAEERELLLLGDELYDKNYAVSTLREQLRVTADQHGEEILGLRYDAWIRLLTTFRAIYAGAKHDRLKLPAHGGSLFNPDRFPFLEGRLQGTSWKDTAATPLPVSNRTVLHLLEALQVLQVRLPGGGAAEARKLSFRSLDIEQIGHVYEGLLDHTAKRASEPFIGLQGTRDKEPEIAVAELEKIAAKGEKELLEYLADETGRSESAIKKGLAVQLDDQAGSRFRTACQDGLLLKRVELFAGLVRLDTVGYPVVITPGSIFVTAGTDRRSSGTHYTPKSLTEPIVQYTLEPLVYVGPAEGLPKAEWKLRSPKELLDLKICDMACGSGAFLVQAGRYMSARLLEAWRAVQQANPGTMRITPEGERFTGKPGEMLIPDDSDERQTYALRIIAQRCLYGVDKNPLAAEMAKLSLWLLTLSKGKPFEFLDHAIRCGDSLVGIHNLDQLGHFSLDGKGDNANVILTYMESRIKEAISKRRQITEMQANTVEDVEEQDRLLQEANEKMDRLRCAADFLISAEFVPGSAADKRSARDDAAIKVAVHFNDSDLATFRREAHKALASQVTFHWPLEFPEVMVERGGFDAFIGNPPFLGGIRISAILGDAYLSYLRSQFGSGDRADLCSYFFIRAFKLLSLTGACGFLATNTIAQGDSRVFGLARLCEHAATIYRATPTRKWPGTASIEVAEVWITKRTWLGTSYLAGQPLSAISSYLDESPISEVHPIRLAENFNILFKGVDHLGEGFLLKPEEAAGLIEEDARNADVVMPFLNGKDLNATPNHDATRWAVYFRDWPLSRISAPKFYTGHYAEDFPACLKLVEERVKPYRQRKDDAGDYVLRSPLPQKWWVYNCPRLDLYSRIAPLSRVLARPELSNTHAVAVLQKHILLSNQLCVFALDGLDWFALLQSTIHEVWARKYASSMRTDMRYTTADCFETFPRPREMKALSAIGAEYERLRLKAMQAKDEGLTKTYARFNNANVTNAEIQKLRELHVRMDQAVAAAYGWTDLDLDHGFHETKQGVRYTISEPARRQVLARLLKLNHERYVEEVKQGLHAQRKGKAAKKPPKVRPVAAKKSPAQEMVGLFDVSAVDTAFPATDRDRQLCGLLCDLIAAQPRMHSHAYLDALVIAVGYERHARLLIGDERKQFKHEAQAYFGKTPTAAKIAWGDLTGLVTSLQVCQKTADGAFVTGDHFSDRRTNYPACTSTLVRLVLKAAANLRELQGDAAPLTESQRAEVAEFNEDRQAFAGVTQ